VYSIFHSFSNGFEKEMEEKRRSVRSSSLTQVSGVSRRRQRISSSMELSVGRHDRNDHSHADHSPVLRTEAGCITSYQKFIVRP